MKISMLAVIVLLLAALAPLAGASGTGSGAFVQNGLQTYILSHPGILAQIKAFPIMLTSITPPVVSMGLAIIVV